MLRSKDLVSLQALLIDLTVYPSVYLAKTGEERRRTAKT